MRELQGGIIGSSLFIIFLGISGLLTAVLHFISPITGAHRLPITCLGRQHALRCFSIILPVTGARGGACTLSAGKEAFLLGLVFCQRAAFDFQPRRV